MKRVVPTGSARPLQGMLAAALVGLPLMLASQTLQAERLTVSAGHSELTFDSATATPVAWVLCLRTCATSRGGRQTLLGENDGFLRIGAAPPVSPVEVRREDTDAAVVLVFSSSAGDYRYELQRQSALISVELPPGAQLQFAPGEGFVPEQLPGFGHIYSRVKAVQVDARGQRTFDSADDVPELLQPAGPDNWTGVRNRYWALLARPDHAGLRVGLDLAVSDRPRVSFAAPGGGESARFTLYAGPTDWSVLRNAAPELSAMLFSALWDFLRALCFGMLLLLGWLHALVGNYGVAIILLSLTVKILMTPLTRLADSWQADVNRTHSLLQPQIDAIRKQYKGEEAHYRTLDVYKKNNVSQFYTFKSAAGFLIQIPVFIAAFDMLAENIALREAAFLWIDDLAKPDRLLHLPLVLPFFGGWLNLLPFLMTALSSLAALLQQDSTLTGALQKQQSTRLYVLSAAFFVLFYTFPAGMVLYWTSSNLFHLLKVEAARLQRFASESTKND